MAPSGTGDASPGSSERPVILLQVLSARTGIGVRDGIEDEVGATEGSVGALALVPYGHMRCDLFFLQQPVEDLRRSVCAVSAAPLRLQPEATRRAVQHSSDRVHLGSPVGPSRLDIDNYRCLEVDEIIVGTGEESVPFMRTCPLRR